MRKGCLILSGGMDSTTLLYDLMDQGYDMECLTFDYGQRHAKEIAMACRTCKKLGIPHKILGIGVLNEVADSSLTRTDQKVPEGHYADETMKSTVVPNRNMVMLSLAASYCMSKKIPNLFYAAHGGDHAIYPDCRPLFIGRMRKVLHSADYFRVDLKVPYMKLDKGKIASIGKYIGVDYKLTWTCYVGGKKPCGKCGACVERAEAFKQNEMNDPLVWKK